MLTKVQKWGNSLGLRIPKSQAEEVCVEAGSAVEITTEKGALIVRPVRRRRYRLSSLLRKVTPRNRHSGVDWGEPVGREAL